MPFKSEKQRKYLWANEPAIARDWTDKYGSRVKKQSGGGIMDQIPFMTGFKLPDVWNQWQQHKLASNLIKEDPGTRDYHQLAAHDFMQRFPNTPDWLGKGLATGYQLASEFGKGILNPSRMSSFLPRALEEARLNRLGIEGLTPDQQARYDSFSKTFDPTIESMYPTDRLSGIWDAIKNEFGGNAWGAETNVASANKSTTSGINGRNGLAKNWSMKDDLEAQNIRPTFNSSDEEQDYYNQIRNKIGKMPTIKDPNIFQRFHNNFYKPATSAAGGYNVSQLNQMNALGGYYSEPARAQRRNQARVNNMMARKAAGKSYSKTNLANLSDQSSGGGWQPDYSGAVAHQQQEAKDMGISHEQLMSDLDSVYAKGGRIGYQEGNRVGGLASLWPR